MVKIQLSILFFVGTACASELKLHTLPLEVQQGIFKHCDIRDLISLSHTNQQLRALTLSYLNPSVETLEYILAHRRELGYLYARRFLKASAPKLGVSRLFEPNTFIIQTGVSIAEKALVGSAATGLVGTLGYGIVSGSIPFMGITFFVGLTGFLPIFPSLVSPGIQSWKEYFELKIKDNLEQRKIRKISSRVLPNEPRLLQQHPLIRTLGIAQYAHANSSYAHSTPLARRSARALLAGKLVDGAMTPEDKREVDMILEIFGAR